MEGCFALSRFWGLRRGCGERLEVGVLRVLPELGSALAALPSSSTVDRLREALKPVAVFLTVGIVNCDVEKRV